MKKILFFLLIIFAFLQANNFRDGMLFYKNSDFKKAKKSFELAISQDNAMQANFMLGKMYLYGEGVSPQRDKAIQYLKKASQNGNIRANCYLSEAYLKNNTNRDKIISLLKKGLEKNLKECKKIKKIYDIKIKQGKMK
ncbi:MAG: hypothetical protein QM482_04870 [Sulfurospirillum sp.]